MFTTLFAHDGVNHETVTEEASHLLITEWYVALPLIILVIALIARLIYLFTKSLGAAYTTVAAGLFIGGVALYSLSPITSVVCLAAGFALILFQVLTDLRGSK